MRFARSPHLAKASYAHAAILAGGTVITAGACPVDANGRLVGGADIALQAETVLSNLVTALEAAGCTLDDVVKTTIYVVVPEDEDASHEVLDGAWERVHAAFAATEPASTLVGVARLGFRGQLIEVEAVAEPAHLSRESQM